MPSSPAAMGGDAPRGGVRGGRDQFNWEEIKTDKFRECYLGASVKASVGRWQKNRDVLWYTRDGGPGGAQAAADELASVKAEEERLMQEALGLRPRREPPAVTTFVSRASATRPRWRSTRKRRRSR